MIRLQQVCPNPANAINIYKGNDADSASRKNDLRLGTHFDLRFENTVARKEVELLQMLLSRLSLDEGSKGLLSSGS